MKTGRPALGLRRYNCALDRETEAAVRAAFSRLEARLGGLSLQRFLGRLVARGLTASRLGRRAR